jgi:hypothetical protein
MASRASATMAVIDLDPIFLNSENIDELFFTPDVHWNRKGHFLVGRSLLEKIGEILRE